MYVLGLGIKIKASTRVGTPQDSGAGQENRGKTSVRGFPPTLPFVGIGQGG